MRPRRTAPPVRSCSATASMIRLGTAKATPSLPPPMLPERIAVLMPTSRPALSSNGPPELPEFTAASVWM